MIDFTRATNCINIMKRNGTYRGQKIGIVRQPLKGLFGILSEVPHHEEGEIVLYTEELEPSNSQMKMGEYQGQEQRPTGRVTVESPLTQAQIDKHKAQGSLIATTGTMINVPAEYIEEVRI